VNAPTFLQLAGHPLRWRLLAELSRSDRMVHELTAAIGEPQNLVSYHLGKLRDARLVSARRSDADRRDAYYTVDLTRIGGLLSATGAALHPGLRLSPPTLNGVGSGPVTMLFLCTGNSARSQMAEVLVEALSGGTVRACSAGSHPKPVHRNAARVLREEHGLELGDRASKHFDVYAGRRFDWVISLCDRVREVCPELPGHPDDEATYPLFRQTAAELTTRIGFLLAALAKEPS
jgi:protein-tyrosine-phosphatase